ncbi:hypothetical protein J2Z81_000074 [Virgibacillus campisalis]|uniref:Transposase n=1 Tax=Virgibacillus alimentarius TaxID=698769 RepID=A0ABS4S3S3_9BACI|nr:hypothetical protein [Virgibacillus alimentarius]
MKNISTGTTMNDQKKNWLDGVSRYPTQFSQLAA